MSTKMTAKQPITVTPTSLLPAGTDRLRSDNVSPVKFFMISSHQDGFCYAFLFY